MSIVGMEIRRRALVAAIEGESILWGIYYKERELAPGMDDPLRTIIQATSKHDAELQARLLGFDSPWAHPLYATSQRDARRKE